MRKIVLASASPRRKQIFALTGLKFEIDPSEYEEDLSLNLPPKELVIQMSQGKAKQVAKHHQNAIVIGADTVIVYQGEIIGKPQTQSRAKQILSKLSGQSHSVITGFTIIDTANNQTVAQAIETRVTFKQLSPEEIISYVESGEPLDKAGAYAIQGLGAVLIERIEGDYYNVVGLPLCALVNQLKKLDIFVL